MYTWSEEAESFRVDKNHEFTMGELIKLQDFFNCKDENNNLVVRSGDRTLHLNFLSLSDGP